MNTTAPAPARPGPQTAVIGLARAVAAEWIKLRSVRSTWWCATAAVLGMVAFAALLGYTASSTIAEDPAAASDYSLPQLTSQGVFYLVQFVVLALSALVATNEYANRGIASTLRWAPRRGRVLAARTLVTAAFAFGMGALSTALGTIVFALFLGTHTGLDPGQALRTVLGVGVGMSLLAVLFVGMGTALRGAAGTTTTGFLLLLGIPLVLQLSQAQFLNDLAGYFPGMAGIEFYAAGDVGFYTAPHDGLVNVFSLLGWATAAQIVGYAELRGRDA